MWLEPTRFQEQLLAWFNCYGRKELPWQHPRTPYRVWLSEIMLQQTQVTTVILYFQRFIQQFPDLRTLAQADIDKVLALWSGLGYYARARNLHRCAQRIVREYGGEFPCSAKVLQSLPGIGRSTAGAILALGFAKRAPILDGNVKRILARVHAIHGWPNQAEINKQLWVLADHYTPQQQVADYTQAMMDLGALVCTLRRPKCQQCPLQNHCLAYAQGQPTAYPTPKPRKPRSLRSMQLLIVLDAKAQVLLEKRPPCGIWGGLWSLPECPCDVNILEWCRQRYYCQPKTLLYQAPIRHEFTHLQVDIHPVLISVDLSHSLVQDAPHLAWHDLKQLNTKGLAAPIRQLLNKLLLEDNAATNILH